MKGTYFLPSKTTQNLNTCVKFKLLVHSQIVLQKAEALLRSSRIHFPEGRRMTRMRQCWSGVQLQREREPSNFLCASKELFSNGCWRTALPVHCNVLPLEDFSLSLLELFLLLECLQYCPHFLLPKAVNSFPLPITILLFFPLAHLVPLLRNLDKLGELTAKTDRGKTNKKKYKRTKSTKQKNTTCITAAAPARPSHFP